MIAELPKPLRLFWGLNVFLSMLCLVIMRGNKYLFHATEVYVFPVLPFDHWVDFSYFEDRFQYFHSPQFFVQTLRVPFPYPAPMALLYQLFYLPPRHRLFIFLMVTAGSVVVLAVILGRAMMRRGISAQTTALFLLSTACVSYPLWFEFLLGNMEVCVFLIVAAGMIAFIRRRFYLAATIFAVAASLKIFPFVYLALLLSRKKYRELALGVAVVIVLNLASLWILCPSLSASYHGMAVGLDYFRSHYTLAFRPIETGFDHSLFGFIKRVCAEWHIYTMPSRVLSAYLVVVSVSGLLLYLFKIRKLPFLNQAVCLCIASILLPPTSHDYTLLHLYVPWALMLLYALDKARESGSIGELKGVFVCFAVLLSAESELIFHWGFSGEVKAIALVALLILALKNPWTSEHDRSAYA